MRADENFCQVSRVDPARRQDTSLVSPDGKFTVTFGFRSQDGEMVLSVLNNKTGQVYKSVPTGPCYFLKWAPDSRTMVAIYPMSGGDTSLRCTPAMEAGVTNSPWTVANLVEMIEG